MTFHPTQWAGRLDNCTYVVSREGAGFHANATLFDDDDTFVEVDLGVHATLPAAQAACTRDARERIGDPCR